MSNRSSHRLVYFMISFLTMALIVFLLGNLFRYFHSNNVVVNKYDIGLSQLRNHNPPLSWLEDDPDIKGEINKYIRKEITDAYLDAWGILNLSIKEQLDLGLKENFTETKAKQLRSALKADHGIRREDLSHNLNLHFISYDKQVVSFTDKEMILQICVMDRTKKSCVMDTSDYKVLMTLNDGRWRVNKMVRL